MAAGQPAAREAAVSFESLAELFPNLGFNVLRDVVEQCDNNHDVALERLLAMSVDSSEGLQPSPAAVMPQTRQGQRAMLFPAERPRAPPTAPHHPLAPSLPARATAATAPTPSSVDTVSLLLPDYPGVLHDGKAPPIHPDPHSWSDGTRYWLDNVPNTGQQGSAGPPASASPRKQRQRRGCARGWWPVWPPDPGERGPSRASGAGCCLERGMEALAQHCQGAGQGGPSSEWQPPPPPPLPPPPPDARPASPDTLAAAGGHAPEEVLIPHLAHLLASPAHSPAPASPETAPRAAASPPLPLRLDGLQAGEQGAAVLQRPAQHAQRNEAQRDAVAHDATWEDDDVLRHAVRHDAVERYQQGFAPEDLVLAVDFHSDMFPNLRREVVADVLQRYSETPQVALDQLMMLSAAVAEAAPDGGSPVASDGEAEGSAATNAAAVPDAWGWTDDGAVLLEHGSDTSGWDAYGPAPPPPVSNASNGRESRLDGWSEAEAMGAAEKLQLLIAEFGSQPPGEVSAALAACDGGLMAAAQLLRAVAEEEKGERGAGSRGAAAAAATVPAAAVPHSAPAHGGAKQARQAGAAGPGVSQLAQRFPGASREALEVALVGCSGDLAATLRTLREAGYAELSQHDSSASAGGPQGAAPSAPPPPGPTPAAGPQPPPLGPPPGLPLPLSEATYRRNQAIFQEERAAQQRLQLCYRRCFELAAAAYERGDRATADELRARGHEYRQQYEEERRRASRRIGKRVNAGTLPVISVDLHGKYVDEALETVEAGIRSLPESIPGGVVVRYITGKGLHSTGGAARIKPEVLRLLSQRGLPHEDRGGFVEVTLAPAA